MEAKLFLNMVGEFYLIVDECPSFVLISEPISDGYVIASVHHDDRDFLKISLKNCESIKNGFDLDELAKTKYGYDKTEMFSCVELDCKSEGFIEGAKTILELMGNKKFTEQDVRKAINEARFCSVTDEFGSVRFHYEDDKIIQSIQQNEWEVEIEMRSKDVDELRESGEGFLNNKNLYVPKLDSNGCLILKRK